MQTDPRLDAIKQWIASDLGFDDFTLESASADASFRRYFRLLPVNGDSFIIMDAPPEKEDCSSFIKVARLLEECGVHAPHIYDFNEVQGFMRLSDLGCTSYLDKLNELSVDALYSDAIKSIVKMQDIEAELPPYDEGLLMLEMSLFKDWYLEKHLNIFLSDSENMVLQKTFTFLVESALSQRQAFVHRDYHSRNLMIVEDEHSSEQNITASSVNPGVIDFQDAVIGSVCYDLVSLIKDCYIVWPRDRLLRWIDTYLELTPYAFQREDFIKSFDLMGLQRHIKVAGIFSRLNYRDGKAHYLEDIPLTLAYIFDVLGRYEELKEFKNLLSDLGIKAEQNLLDKIQ